jgi:hypothetical protein
VFVQDRRLWVRLREKGGKRHEMPCRHNLESYLQAYLDGGGIAADPKRPLFRTIGRTTGQLTTTPLPQANAHAMTRRRAARRCRIWVITGSGASRQQLGLLMRHPDLATPQRSGPSNFP